MRYGALMLQPPALSRLNVDFGPVAMFLHRIRWTFPCDLQQESSDPRLGGLDGAALAAVSSQYMGAPETLGATMPAL
jgi:hypothetical protein